MIRNLSLLCLAAGLFTAVASAQTSLYIDNAGFELPATGKISAGWDVAGANDVPGWMDAGVGNGDSGIESPNAHAHTGVYGGYARGGDPGAYQITTNTMSWGKKYTLTWWGSESWNNSVERTSLLRADATNAAYASCTEIAMTAPTMLQDYSWNQYTNIYIAGNADVGKYIGIAFRNTGPGGGSWCNWDDFELSVADASPAELMVNITAQPVGQTVYEGSPVTFAAAATGPDVSYQWKAGATGSGIYTNIPGATSATLTIAFVTAANAADYVLFATNSASSVTSDPATLTVNLATYANGLFNGDFELPGTGKISSGFDASGNDVPGWRNAGPNQSDTGIESAGSGHDSTYAAYLQKGQSGAYQISPTNITQAGEVITLSWWARDSWQGLTTKVSLLSASSQDAAFGSTTILASLTNVLDGSWWTQYTINYTAVAGDVGKKIGVAIQTAGPDTSGGWGNIDDISLVILPPDAAPIIITQPSSQTGYLAGQATFTVIATGNGLNYQWQAGAVGSGIYTNLSNGGQFSGATAASLTISNLTVDNGLDYVVIVSNTGGSVTSTPPATLTVDTSVPVINTQPASITRLTTETATFTVATTGAVSYQWKAGAVGSGIYTNLSNGGQFSGVNTATLNVANLQVANQADYVVEVSNGAGPVTSGPATLTILNGIYSQDFETSSNVITAVGWVADSTAGQAVLGAPYWGGKCIFDAEGTNLPLAYYTSTLLNHGNIPGEPGFPVINLASVSNLTFYTDVQSWWNPGSEHTYFIVQMNGGDWYSSATELTSATGGQETRTMLFDTNSTAWNQLTVSGNGSATSATIGAAATNNLTGYITGAGLVTVHDSSSWINLDNFKISGDGFTVLPGLSIAKSGANVVLTWGYGTLVESTSVTGPWTPASGTSPKTVSPTGSQFYRLQLP
jgi:hypothetical protein